MPITQDRMLALIDAAKDFKQGLDAATALVRQAHDTVRSGGNAEAELDRLFLVINDLTLMKQPVKHTSLILLEEKHFKMVRGENERRKILMQNKRAGMPSRGRRKTAPRGLFDADELPGATRLDSVLRIAETKQQVDPGFENLSEDTRAALAREAQAVLDTEEKIRNHQPKGIAGGLEIAGEEDSGG